MTDIKSRLGDALRESLAPWITGFCSGAEIDVDEDYLLSLIDELSDEITGELLSLPGIAIVAAEDIRAALHQIDPGASLGEQHVRAKAKLALLAAAVQAQEEQ